MGSGRATHQGMAPRMKMSLRSASSAAASFSSSASSPCPASSSGRPPSAASAAPPIAGACSTGTFAGAFLDAAAPATCSCLNSACAAMRRFWPQAPCCTQPCPVLSFLGEMSPVVYSNQVAGPHPHATCWARHCTQWTGHALQHYDAALDTGAIAALPGGKGRTSMVATSTAVLGMPRLLAAECLRKEAMDTAKILKKWYMPSPRKTATAKNTYRKTETTNQRPQTVLA